MISYRSMPDSLIGANKAESHIGSGCCVSDRQSYPLASRESMAIVWSQETVLSEGSQGIAIKQIKHCK
jgi:hypothetical protein